MGPEFNMQEQQLAFSFSTLPVLEILHTYTGDGTQILEVAPGITSIHIDDLKERLGTFSSAIEDIKTTPPDITAQFLMLEERQLSQLATLAVENSLNTDELKSIANSPAGIKAEIVLRHIEFVIAQNPYSRVILGEYDEKILLSKLRTLEENGDLRNAGRIEQILQRVTRYSAMKERYIKACLKESKTVETV